MSRFHLTPAARDDLRAIVQYIQRDSPNAALQVLDDIRRAMRRLARSPGIGHVRDDLADELVRFWAVHSFLIVYRDAPRPIQIVRVLHGSRDVRSILRDPS